MRCIIIPSAIIVSLLLALIPREAEAGISLPDPIFEGESRNVAASDREIRFHQPKGLYATLGAKSYVIGCQDGSFPDFGHLIPGEMGGVWAIPIKVLDGFWLKIDEPRTGESKWAVGAGKFTTRPHECELDYGELLSSLQVRQKQCCPQQEAGVLVVYEMENTDSVDRELVLEFVVRSEIRGVFDFAGDRNESEDVLLRPTHGMLTFRDGTNTWFGTVGCGEPDVVISRQAEPCERNAGKGVSAALRCRITVPANGKYTVRYGIAGSTASRKEAVESCSRIIATSQEIIREKINTMAEAIGRSAISIPDKQLEYVYDWNKVHIEWMVSDLPHLGRYLHGGAVTYPFLFCDMYSIQALCAMGDHALAKSTLKVLREQSERANGNGRIVHEVSAMGTVGNRGNTQETAHYIAAVGEVFKWTGDTSFLKEHYPYMQQGISWLLDTCDADGNLIPEGNGIIEVQGLNAEVIDVACYTQQALVSLAEAAAVLGDSVQSARYAEKAEILSARIDSAFWHETNGTYADFVADGPVAQQVIRGAIRQLEINRQYGIMPSPQAETYYEDLLARIDRDPYDTLKKPRISNCNWIINIPLETGIAPADRALRQLDKVREQYTGPHGLYISGIEQDRVMTITNGVQAVCEARYGRIDEALWYVHRITDTFGYLFPGGIYEMTPDWGCPVIAWTSYGIVVPLISYVFGVHPDAMNRQIILKPNLPKEWNELSLRNLKIGDSSIDYSLRRNGKTVYVEVTDDRPGWEYEIDTGYMEGYTFLFTHRTRPAEGLPNVAGKESRHDRSE